MHLNIVELAESFGVEERVVLDWVRHEGLPHMLDRGRFLFDRAQVIAWAAERGHAARVGFLAAQSPGAEAASRVTAFLRQGGIWRDVPAAGALDVIGQVLGRMPGVTPAVRQLLNQRLHAADGLSWAAIGEGLALPHLRVPVALGRDAGICAILFLTDALPLAAPDASPVNRLFFFVAPTPRAHLEMLAELSGALSRGGLKHLLQRAAGDDEIFAALAAGTTGGRTGEGRG